MKKSRIYLFLLLALMGARAKSQSTEELLNALMADDTPHSYAKVSLGISNKLFSVNNNSLNAMQVSSKLLASPSVSYIHKSGFSLSATGYMLLESGNTGLLQVAVTPAYEFDKKKFAGSVSYSHYFVTHKYDASNTPIQNDFYANALYKKGFINPGLAIGYAFGKYREIAAIDTAIGNVHIHYIDTITTKLNSFSFIASIEHSFKYRHLFNKDDEFLLQPQLLVNTGFSNESITEQTGININNPNRIPRKRNRKINNRSTSSANSGFQLESLGLNINTAYGLGNFTLEPGIYLDYYLPATDYKRFTQVYSLVLSYSF